MKKYACSVCGFIYDESAGNPETGIAPGTRWDDVPEDWGCPLCGAPKSDFQEQTVEDVTTTPEVSVKTNSTEDVRDLSFGELSAVFSNLSKGCAKQYRPEESNLFNQLAEYYRGKVEAVEEKDLGDLLALIQQDLESRYSTANGIATKNTDRGSLRALVWGEKVTKILRSLITRYEKQQDALLENTNVYVCDICGFVAIGDEAPDICPICKVPGTKITKIQRSK